MNIFPINNGEPMDILRKSILERLREISLLNNVAAGPATAQAQLAILRDLVLAKQESDRNDVAPQLLEAGASEQRLEACVDLIWWLRPSDYWTYEVIAAHLNAHGQVTRRGRAWTKSSVGQALTNFGGDQR